MKLADAKAQCQDILMIEKAGRNTCAHLEKPYCRLPSRLFCVFYKPLTGGVARRIDEPVAAPAASLTDGGNAAPLGSSVAATGSSLPHDEPPAPGSDIAGTEVPAAIGIGAGGSLRPATAPQGLPETAEARELLAPEVPALEPPPLPARDGEPRAFRPSITSVGTYSACPRRFRLRYIDRWRPKMDGPALVVSRLFDRGLNALHGSGSWSLADLAATPEEQECIGSIGLVTVAACLDGYRDHAPTKPPKIGGVQFRFQFPWGSYPEAFGIADFWDSETRTLWEYKFVRDADELSMRYRFQMAVYARALKAESIIYYPIRKPALKLGKAESADKFASRVAADIERRPGHYFCPRRYVPGDFASIDTDQALTHLEAALEDTRPEVWFQNWSACDGPMPCDFLPICQAGGLVDEALYSRGTR